MARDLRTLPEKSLNKRSLQSADVKKEYSRIWSTVSRDGKLVNRDAWKLNCGYSCALCLVRLVAYGGRLLLWIMNSRVAGPEE